MCPNRPVVWKCSILGEGAHCYRKRPTLVEATTHEDGSHTARITSVAARSYPHIIQNTSMIPYARTMCTVGSMSPRLHTGAKILADRGWLSDGTNNERSSQELSTYHSKYIHDTICSDYVHCRINVTATAHWCENLGCSVVDST